MTAPAPAAVGFDFDHTLGLDNGLETTAFYRLGAELGHSISERDPRWAAFITDLLARFRTAAISLDGAVEAFIAELGSQPPPHGAARYRAICFGLVDELVTPIEGARDVLAALAGHAIPTAILTNGWSPLQHLKVARALDYHGPLLVSDQLGVLKPATAAFARLGEVLGVPHDRIWYVGDNPTTDIRGARDAGMHPVWFDWEHLAYPAGMPAPEMRIAHLAELLGMLRGSDGAAENLRR